VSSKGFGLAVHSWFGGARGFDGACGLVVHVGLVVHSWFGGAQLVWWCTWVCRRAAGLMALMLWLDRVWSCTKVWWCAWVSRMACERVCKQQFWLRRGAACACWCL
jgi:hypothetical protein